MNWPMITRKIVDLKTLASHSIWERNSAALMASAAICQGELVLAETTILAGGDAALCDASCLNLLGVIAEKRHDWKLARRMYGRSIRADRRFEPAQQNMRRWFELFTFGRSSEPVALTLQYVTGFGPVGIGVES